MTNEISHKLQYKIKVHKTQINTGYGTDPDKWTNSSYWPTGISKERPKFISTWGLTYKVQTRTESERFIEDWEGPQDYIIIIPLIRFDLTIFFT